MIKYSVIIPIYNAEKTLERCVSSLLSENYPDCEIILVNDGSTDHSAELCADYANADSRVRFFSKENGGVSTARNAGLDLAEGEYVLFVDSDDYVLQDFFAALDALLEQNNADLTMASCGHNKVTINDRPVRTVSYIGRKELIQAIINAICRKTINGPVAKIYKRAILNDHHIRFPVGASVAEDRVFNICYSFYIDSLQISDKVLYCVDTGNENSLSRKRHSDLNKQFAVTRQYFKDHLNDAPIPESEKEQYRRAVNFGSCRYIYHEAKLLHANNVGWWERQKKLGRLCDSINRRHLKYPDTSYCRKITLPVRLRLTWLIDAIAWKLTR